MQRNIVAFTLASALAAHGLRKKSLSPSGAAAAFIVGFLMLSSRVSAFGVSLIVFYLVGSRATKIGKQKKAKLEDAHQEAGYRSAYQVLCNSFSAFVASVAWAALFDPDSLVGAALPSTWRGYATPYNPDKWCPLSEQPGDGWSRFLLLVTLG